MVSPSLGIRRGVARRGEAWRGTSWTLVGLRDDELVFVFI